MACNLTADRWCHECTVPTLTFGVLYCLFVIEHGRRRIVHLNITAHPTSEWIVQQLRQAFPLPCPQRYVVLDRDAKFGSERSSCVWLYRARQNGHSNFFCLINNFPSAEA